MVGVIFIRMVGKRAARIAVGVVATVTILVIGHGYLRKNNTVCNFIFPPKGFYEPLVTMKLEYDKSEYEFEISHMYPGGYSVAIDVPTSDGIGVMYERYFQTSVEIETGAEQIYKRDASYPNLNYWRDVGGGLTLDIYDVPNLVEKGKPVSFKISILGDIAGFVEKYGEAKIVMSKYSDG